jgi:hypothetical protein
MKDKTYLYNSFPVKILSFKFDGDYCTLATSGPWITQPHVQMMKVLDQFLDADEDEPTTGVTRTEPEYVLPKVTTLNAFPDLTTILMDNIKKVQEDKGYVEQAQQVSLSVKMIVDLAKTEIEAVKAVTDIYRNR